MEEIKPTGPAIGAIEDAEFELGEIHLNGEEGVLCYTDGLLDIRNKDGDSFGSQKLRDLVKASSKNHADLMPKIMSEVNSFSRDAVQYDDITILGLWRK